MDAVVFQKEWARMCRSYDDCKDCPLRLNGCSDGLGAPEDIAEKRVEIVEKWSNGHPLSTNGQKFIEEYKDVITSTKREDNGNLVKIYMYADWWDAEYKEER